MAEPSRPAADACPRCGAPSPVRLAPGQACAACAADDAWERHRDGKLVIDHADIAAAVARRRDRPAGHSSRRRAAGWVALAAVPAAGAVGFLAHLRARVPLGPPGALISRMLLDARGTSLLGATAVVAAGFALHRLRGGRHFRDLPLLGGALAALCAGAVALGFGSLSLVGGVLAVRHRDMPPRTGAAPSEILDAVMAATVAIVAPDADGDARNAALGTGAVVATEGERVFLVTCSHVAMPYVPVGSRHRAAQAAPVLVQFADGRSAQGRVRWTAPPPLDVALLEARLAHPPAPVAISADSEALTEGAAVQFVPLPYRHGWIAHRGRVQRRERHATPAGEYSLVYTDLPVVPGDSGSGLYDEAGRLVGLNTWARIGGGPPEGISLPAEAMRALVEALDRGRLDELEDRQGKRP
jgi:S1-C subfamily serine protease